MNIKYFISPIALITLTIASCWGAIPDVPQATYLLHHLENPITHDNGEGVGQLIPTISTAHLTFDDISDDTIDHEIPVAVTANITFDDISDSDVFEHIINFLDPKSLMVMAQVNMKFKRLAKKELKMLNALLLRQHNNDPQAALFDAIKNNKQWAVPSLIKKVENINATNENDESALTFAINHNNKTIVKQLLKARANIWPKNAQSASQLATAHNYREIKYILIKEECKVFAWYCCDCCCCTASIGGLTLIALAGSLLLLIRTYLIY